MLVDRGTIEAMAKAYWSSVIDDGTDVHDPENFPALAMGLSDMLEAVVKDCEVSAKFGRNQ